MGVMHFLECLWDARGCKTFDGLPRKLGDFGIETSIFAAQVFVAAEEVLELGAPLMVLLGLYAYTLRRNEE